jgi:D-glycero-alpha-D-manno-heptose-7-phosphate kinase
VTSFHATAPVRLDFAGGWTDVAPFSTTEGGAVVNAAIDLHVSATVTPGGEQYRLEAADLGERLDTDSIASDGHLGLHKAALRRGGMGPCRLRTISNAPAGSGLGSSGALGVTLVAAIDAARAIQRAAWETAEEAWQVEAVDAQLAGGRQDQYAAALGGFNHFRFAAEGVRVDPIVLDSGFANRLAECTIVCYTGASRISSHMIARVMDGYAAKDPRVTAALRGIASLAGPMAAALRDSDLHEVGRLLTANWQFQMALDPGMQTAEMARLEGAMERAGSMGGKAAGAGAGGCMFFVCADPAAARQAAEEAGTRVIPCHWASEGVHSWRE